MDKVRIGIVGSGIGRCHAEGYKKRGDAAEIVAVCDIDWGRAEWTARDYGARHIFSDYNEMMRCDEIDAVSICTPNALHAPIAISAFEAGKHVLCEKPLSVSASEGQKMLDASRGANKIFMMMFNNRFRGDSQLLKKYIEAGDLGEIYYAKTGWLRRRGIPGMGGWFTTKAMAGGGPLIDLGVHMLDLTLWLMGNPKPVEVLGTAYSKFGPKRASENGGTFDVEDLATGLIKLDNGATIHLEASWESFVQKEEIYCKLMGTEGGAELDPLRVYKDINGEPADITPQFKPISGHDMAVSHFVDCVREGREPISTGEQGLHIMKILDAIYESTRTGKGVEITY